MTVMYGIIVVVLMGVVNWDVLGKSTTPVLDVAEVAFGTLGIAGIGVGVLTFAGLLATVSSANASILASPRINFAMGRDELVSDKLNAIHPNFATPYRSITVTGGLILLFIVIGDVETLAKAGSVLHLIVYGLLNIALIVMREADTPEYQPEFEVPLYPVVPILGANHLVRIDHVHGADRDRALWCSSSVDSSGISPTPATRLKKRNSEPVHPRPIR